MATLIQSKQIEGIVTASVVTGEFLIDSGSFIATGSNSILGPVTASSISSSFVGDGSGITGITYSQVDGTPQFVGGNNVTITSSSNVITVNAILDGTGSDAQNLTISGDQITILGGNTITIPTGSNVSDYFELSNIPQGIVSSSVQILGGSEILSGSKTDITLLNTFSSSIQSEVDSLTAATSSYLTSSGSVNFSDVTNKPSGLVSSSDQITITESQISDLTHYGDSDVKTKLDAEGVVSGSYVESLPHGVISGSEQLPSGLISGSSQITITQSQISDLEHTDVANLNTFSASIQSEVDSLTSATSSYITEIPHGTISGSEQLPSGLVSSSDQITITESQISDLTHTEIPQGTISGSEQLPSGLISSSNQITITESQISDLDKYTNTDVQTYLDSVGVVSGSVVAELPSGTVSGSQQVIDSLPDGVVSGSSQITITESQISDLTHTQIPQGTISGSEQLPSGLISSSNQITITESQISDLVHYTDSDVKTKLDVEGVISGSTQITDGSGILSGSQQVIDSLPIGVISGSEQLPQGVISGSEQLPSGLVSSSVQITITESQISDLSHTDISNLNTFTSSIQSEVDSLTAATSSYLTSIDSGIVSSSAQVTELLPDGVVSGSSQITITESQISDLTHYTDSDVKSKLNLENVVSGSYVQSLPQGTISGSSQITITESQISDLTHYTDSDVKTKLDTEGVISGSFIEQLPSGTVSGSTQITDGSNIVSSSIQVTELLPDGVVSGSTQLTDGSGIISSSVQLTESLDTRYLEINGDNVISSSQQVIDILPSGIISGSTYTNLSSSVYTNTDLLQEVSGANYIESSSVNTRLDTIEGSVGAYYDVSNTVWNQKYIRPGSEHYSNVLPFNTNAGNNLFTFTLNDSAKLNYLSDKVVYIHNFDRDTKIVAQPIEGDDGVYYNTGSREVTFKVLEVNGNADSGSTVRINDSYWILSRHTAGFVDSATYTEASESFDYRIDVIVASGSGADWNVNLTNIPQGIVSSSQQQYSASIDNGFALTSSLNDISTSLDTKIDNVYLSSSNFDNKTLVSGSEQIDFRNITNYVADEHIDHTTVLINAGDGLDGGGDISSTRELRLNVTSSHFETGVTDILTSEGVVKTSTLDDDIVGTDFSQSVDSRLNAAVAGTVPDGTVSGSTQVDIEQTQNYTAFSSSIATSIAAVDGGGVSSFNDLTNVPSGLVSGSSQITDGSTIVSGSVIRTFDGTGVLSGSKTDVSLLNTFTSSAEQRLDSLETFTSSLDDTYATDSELSSLSASVATTIDGIQHTQIPSGTVSGSDQLTSSLDDRYALSGSSIDTSTFATTGSNTFSGSQFITGSIIPEASGGNGLHDLGSPSNPFRELYVTTGSVQFVRDGNVISRVSGEKDAIRVGNILITTSSLQIVNNAGNVVSTIAKANRGLGNDVESSEQVLLPDGTISGSHQITDFGFLSGSLVGSGSITITSGSGVITISSEGGASTWDELSGIPDGLISESQQVEIDDVNGFTSFSSSVDTRLDNAVAGNVPSGTVSSSAQITYDGDRVISNDKLGDLFTDSVNPGTSGSVIDFLNAVFYPNSAPSITTGNQTISEYTTNGSTIVTIEGTDPEGQVLTFGTATTYTDDLVRVASNGVMTLNTLPTSASFNTDAVGGVHGHKVEVTATDTFGTITEKDIYIIVTPNEAPKFRETSVSGNIITSVTSNLNENSANNTLVKRVYFTDVEGDTITITTGSIDNEHFDVTIYSNYLDIRQNTGSLDYEQQTTYTFSITASDEHYEDGDDLDSVTYLPVTINVTDNLTPTISDQTLSSINENTSDGVTVGSISAADNESDTITFQNFELHQLQLDGSVVTSGSYSGTSQLSDPHENPFQMNSSGVVTRKTGVYLNSDLINKYIYRVEVTDSYNGSNVGLITIDIDDDTPATISDNWSVGPYIIESALDTNNIRINSNGRTGTQADYDSNQSGTWSSSNSSISINSSGNLSLGVDLSGSVTQSGDTIDSTITFTNTFGTTTTDALSVSVVANQAPTITFTSESVVWNSNQATTGTNLISVAISDDEGDSPYQLIVGGTDGSKLTPVPQNADSSSWQLQASENLSGGTYNYLVQVTDSYGKDRTYNGLSFTIQQGDTGTLGGDTTSYIIESAESGDVLRDASGFGAGNASQLSVSYTNYGSPVVQSYTSSNEVFNIDTSGNITLGLNISGSDTGSGDTISSDITFVDQFGNIGSGSLTVNVFANQAPTATFNENTSKFNENQATGSESLVDVTISDTEGDVPYQMTISGTNANSFNLVPQNANSSSWEIQPASNLGAATYSYNITVTDNFGQGTTYNGRSIVIAAADDGDLVATDTYIIESATNGDLIRRNSDGRSGTQSSVAVSYSPSYGSPVASNFASSDARISIDSAGRLSVGNDISGSGSTNGSIIATTISWRDQYGNNGSEAISVEVTKNNAPTVLSTQTFNVNTNEARGTSEIVRLNVTDTESDSIPNGGLTFSGYNTTYFTPSISTPQMKLLANSTNIPNGTYPYTASIQDVHGFDTTEHSGSVTIAQSDTGTLGGDTAIYIIESAESGDVFRDATGFNQGNAAQLSVSYSPSDGSPVVQSYTSSNDSIVVDSNGNLTLGVDISGSVTQSGDTITTTITFTDQYDNIGSGSVTATVFGNSSPSATFTATSDYDTDASTSGSTAGTLTVTDTENNSPFTITLAGTDGDKFDVGGSSSPFTIQPTGSLTDGSYSINITVTDTYGESVTLTGESITVDAAEVLTTVYIYTSTRTGGGTLSDANYDGLMGITSEDTTTTPDTITGFQSAGPSPIFELKDGHLGDSSITVGGGTLTLQAERSGSNLDTIISSSFNGDGTSAEQIMILFPSGSTLSGIPTSMTDSLGGSTTGEYVLYLKAAGEAGFNAAATQIHQFDVDTDVDGYGTWNIIGRNSTNTAASYEVRMIPSSGSAPS